MTDLDFDTALEDGAVRPGSHFAQRASADAEAARALAGAALSRLPLGAAEGEDDAAWAALGLSDQAEESIELLAGELDAPANAAAEDAAAEMLQTEAYDADAWAPTAPQAVIAPRNRGWMWGVAATFLLGVGAFAAFFGLPDDDDGERFLTPASVASTPGAGVASAAPARAPASVAAMSAASAASAAPESMAPQSAAAPASDAPTPKTTRSARRTPSRRRTAAAARKPAAAEAKPAAAPKTTAPAKRPARASRKAVAEVDNLLDNLGGGAKPAKRSPAGSAAEALADPGLPEKLSKSQILRVVRTNASKISSCKRGGASGTVKVVMVIGGSGRVTSATPGGAFAGTPAGVCVAAKVRTFRFPQFSGDPMRINMPFRL
ncbi:MAG: outer membrane biosynthesis protein TonB [Bradymonadia bacterium]|jgi:outer membrane biosynthesis protein TonB